MKHANSDQQARRLFLMLTLAASSSLILIANRSTYAMNPWTSPLAAAVLGQQEIDPQTVVGRAKCAECHKKELEAWEKSAHATSAWEKLDHPKAPEFAEGLGIAKADIKKSGACVKCHGTEQANGEIVRGNSCESCHGGAGANGGQGWLELHADYGSGIKAMDALLKEREAEAPAHLTARVNGCADAGMIGAENPLAIARNCLQCHIVPNEELIKAGHPSSDKFELVAFAQGEVRHNFLLNQNKNSESPSLWLSRDDERSEQGRKGLMFIAGQLADLEVSLAARAKVSGVKRGTLGRVLNDRIDDAIGEIEDLVKKEGIDGLKPVLDAVDGIDKKTLRKANANIAGKCANAAVAVKDLAEKFIEANKDGGQLPKIKTKKPKGKVFQ